MERNRFDETVKQFGVGASRRQLLGGLIGSAAAALASVALGGDEAIAAKKGGKGKSKGRGKGVNKPVGKGNGIGQGNGGGNAGGGNAGGNGKGNGPAKFSFCHKEGDAYQFVRDVPAPQAKEHRKHADDVECVKDPCKVYNGCDVSEEGGVTCTFAPATIPEGGSIECGEGGTCNAEGTCVEPTIP